MNTIDILKNKFSRISKEFQFLVQENRQLKAKIKQLQDKNDILNRKSEDLILTINSRLKHEAQE
ncbi:MAG: hypothetical protein U9N59_08505 [Campylobacterota bacterium]|nr:hypothetical protein [Campylobacterota bacterium]